MVAKCLLTIELVNERPQGFRGLQLWAVGRQVNEANAVGDLEAGRAIPPPAIPPSFARRNLWLASPSGIVEDQQDNASDAGFGLAREGFEQRLEEWLRHAVGKIPEGLARRRRCESRDVEPVETMMAMRDRTLADGRPHLARDRLQADAMLVRGEDLDWLAGMFRGLLGEGVREVFLNAAASSGEASSGEADFGFFGRGA